MDTFNRKNTYALNDGPFKNTHHVNGIKKCTEMMAKKCAVIIRKFIIFNGAFSIVLVWKQICWYFLTLSYEIFKINFALKLSKYLNHFVHFLSVCIILLFKYEMSNENLINETGLFHE